MPSFSPYGLGRCHDCSDEVRWATTESGAQIALNPEPDPDGKAVARLGEGPGWWFRVPTRERPQSSAERRFTPHAATCRARRRTPAPQAPQAPPVPPPQTHQEIPLPLDLPDPVPATPAPLAHYRRTRKESA